MLRRFVLWLPALGVLACGALKKAESGSGSKGSPSSSADLSCTLVATPAVAAAGAAVTLTLAVSGPAVSAEINGASVSLSAPGTQVTPAANSSYAATVTDGVHVAGCLAAVSVQGASADAPACALTANPAAALAGQSVQLTLTTTGTVSTATLDGTTQPSTGGSKTEAASWPAVFSAQVSGTGGRTSACSVEVTSAAPPTPTPAPSGGQCLVVDSATLASSANAASATTSAAYAAALSAKALTPTTPKQVVSGAQAYQATTLAPYCEVDPAWDHKTACGATTPAMLQGRLVADTLYSFTSNGQAFSFVAGEVQSTCNGLPDYAFGAAADGTIYHIVPTVTVATTASYANVCGCDVFLCGGTAPQTVQKLYVMPSAGSYKGDMPLAYTKTEVSVTYDDMSHSPDGTVSHCEAPP